MSVVILNLVTVTITVTKFSNTTDITTSLMPVLISLMMRTYSYHCQVYSAPNYGTTNIPVS